jgi:nitrate/nitrite transporter NarK
MFSLVCTGELVFGLPFHVPRFFRPTMLEVFNFTNTQLGDLFFFYGITAMIAYFPGGALADKVSARILISVALFSTAIGGLYLATIPGEFQMGMLYGYWGITSIFFLWGAMIRATREWGHDDAQGVAFGVLEGGRGLVAAAFAIFAVNALALYMPDNARLVTPDEREAGFRTVVLLYTAVTAAAGLLAWFTIPDAKNAGSVALSSIKSMTIVMRRPVIWAQAAIIVCAYCGYKGLDNYSLYAVQVLGMDEVEGARLAAYGAWTRPVAAVLAGLIADRFDATRSIGAMFAILFVSYAVWSTLSPQGSGIPIIYINFFTTYIVVFALRGIYFALLEDNRTPKFLTGAAVGMVSLVGYAPDAFFGPVTGRILDANPGIVGHQNYFMFLAAVAATGILVVFWLLWLQRSGRTSLWPETETTTTAK